MDNLPIISEVIEILQDDPKGEENDGDVTHARSESPLHFVDCDETINSSHCSTCRRRSTSSRLSTNLELEEETDDERECGSKDIFKFDLIYDSASLSSSLSCLCGDDLSITTTEEEFMISVDGDDKDEDICSLGKSSKSENSRDSLTRNNTDTSAPSLYSWSRKITNNSANRNPVYLNHFVTMRRDQSNNLSKGIQLQLRKVNSEGMKRFSLRKNSELEPVGDPEKSLAMTVSSSRSMEMLYGVDGGNEKKWARSNSLRRPFYRSRHNSSHAQDPSALSDTEIGKISAPHSLLDGECGSVSGSVTSERGIDVGRVSAWATSFEKLLEDPAGLHTFAEFLKKEYSHENIYFWTACERYKRLSSQEELQAMAKEIFERHLCIGASEPVNVDSQARQDAVDSLHKPDEFLFAQAQKQIFNLMKFDSYSRFLKSVLYQDCLSKDMKGQTLPYPGDESLDSDLRIIQDDSHMKLKKSKSDADERRRKSLLPWHRKDRSKSKDRGEAEYRRKKKINQRNQSDSSSVRSDMSGSRTSLNSSDLPLVRRAVSRDSLTSGELGSLSGNEGYNRCRVIFPDLCNSVIAVRQGESIQELLTRLLERRAISYTTFDVYQNKTDKLLDKTEDSSAIGGLEVRLEQRILFRLDLPNRKTVCVKAKPNKPTSDVLKPILHKYGYKLDLMSIHKVGEEKNVNLKAPVNDIDGDRLVVQTKEEVKEWAIEPGRLKKRGNSLDEITNRVFEDLLKGKSERTFDELGVYDIDARSSL
ncbi:LGN motif protein, partial [Halocaridina rubra]